MLPIVQVILSVLIIVLILLQERSSGLSSIFGGGENAFYQTRRGLEKVVFISTIVLIVVFVGLAVSQLIF